jgi:hypothetical protein
MPAFVRVYGTALFVMPGFIPGIHDLNTAP